jgi:hypothetical protein
MNPGVGGEMSGLECALSCAYWGSLSAERRYNDMYQSVHYQCGGVGFQDVFEGFNAHLNS